MARTAIAVLQPVWDCRWSRPGHRLTGVAEAEQPESRWVCVKDGTRRAVAEHECETCPDWAAEETTRATVQAAATVAVPALPAAGLLWASRAVLAAIAAWLFVIGFSLLTTPAAIPITVAFWLTGAAVVAFTLLWRPPS